MGESANDEEQNKHSSKDPGEPGVLSPSGNQDWCGRNQRGARRKHNSQEVADTEGQRIKEGPGLPGGTHMQS